MFVDKILASTILLACASTQALDPDVVDEQSWVSGPTDPAIQDTEYPLMAQFFAEGATYEDYTWEAHQVITQDEYVKTLFHLTGRKSKEIESNGKPVLIVNGAGSNAMAFLVPDIFNHVPGETRDAAKAKYHGYLEDWIAIDDQHVHGILTTLKEKLTTEQWDEAVLAMAEKGDDLNALLEASTAPDLTEAAQGCADLFIEDVTTRYMTALKEEGTSAMPDYHDSIPIMLLNAGFDVWLDGNRGTKYQRYTRTQLATGEAIPDEEFWDFTSMDMGMYDQPAQIEYILQQTGKESLSYWGYSMGTNQFMYAIGKAQEDEALATTLAKVDKALLLTPCLNAGQIEGTEEERRAIGKAFWDSYDAVETGMLWGEGANKEGDLEALCANMPDEVCGVITMFYDLFDSVSWKTMTMTTVNDAENGMLKEYFEDYGVDGNWPTADHFIDYTTVTKSPPIYTFGTSNDVTCNAAVWRQWEADMGAHIKESNEYNCPGVSHEWFATMGAGQKIVIQDFINALNDGDEPEGAEEDSSVSLTLALAASVSALAMLF